MIYRPAETKNDLKQILGLQSLNIKKEVNGRIKNPNIDNEQGFVTVKHTLSMLYKMSEIYPHVVASDNKHIQGYALVLLKELCSEIPVLIPMFDRLKVLSFKGDTFNKLNYFIMGQICVSKAYRGQKVATQLYHTLSDQMSKDFDYMVTEVSEHNKPSMKMHLNVGFEIIDTYRTEDEEWNILIIKLPI